MTEASSSGWMPRTVWHPMGERLSLAVDADGSSGVMLLDSQTGPVARLLSDGNGGGGVQVFQVDMKGKKILVRTVIYGGDRLETVPIN